MDAIVGSITMDAASLNSRQVGLDREASAGEEVSTQNKPDEIEGTNVVE